ncbi:MAG: type VI secretion system baseplate subunit TssE [Pyrinomonadaceae bacterium]
MAKNDKDIRVTPSVFDRLIDFEPRQSKEAPKSRSSSLRELKQSVRRDLEWLFNTRCYLKSFDIDLEESQKSVAFYGLPDFTGLSVSSPTEQKRFTYELESAIRTFEPRFLDVDIKLEPISSTDRQLRFRIEARLDVEPTPEPISFDTVVQIGNGQFSVTEK